jgi:hypothetical protein
MGYTEISSASLGSSSQTGLSLWVPPVAGCGAALLVALVAGYIAQRQSGQSLSHWIGSGVKAGPAWTLSDSWVTNIAAAGAVLGTVSNSLGALQSVVSSSAAVGVTVLFIVFGGAAAVAPIIYAATAKQEAQELDHLVGSVWGFLLAGIASLVAVMGEIAAVALLVWQVSGSDSEKIALVILLALGSVFVAIYSTRAIVLFGAPTDPSGGEYNPKSLLGVRNNSATL